MISEQNLNKFSSIDAEQGILGAILAFPDAFEHVPATLIADDFIEPIHGQIFAKIKEMYQDGKRASPVTLKMHFDKNPNMPEFYLAELAGSVFTSMNIPSYAETIKKYAEKRRLVQIIEDFKIKAIDDAEPARVKMDLIATLENSTEKSIYTRTKRQAATEFVTSLSLPSNCFPVGIPRLTKTMGGGLYAGFCYGFAGGEKSGKTTTAQTISHNLNGAGVKHAYLALEMGSRQIEQRNIAREIGINSLRFLDSDRMKYARAAAEYATTTPDFTIYLDMAGCSFQQIKAEVMRLVSKDKIKGFILDYWQLVGGCAQNGNKSDFLFEIAQWIAGFCRRENVWSIILSQLNRQGQVLGSAGLERACDQLYVLGAAKDAYTQNGIYMNLTHSRYTPSCQIGDEENPKFEIDFKSGPYLKEIE